MVFQSVGFKISFTLASTGYFNLGKYGEAVKSRFKDPEMPI